MNAKAHDQIVQIRYPDHVTSHLSFLLDSIQCTLKFTFKCISHHCIQMQFNRSANLVSQFLLKLTHFAFRATSLCRSKQRCSCPMCCHKCINYVVKKRRLKGRACIQGVETTFWQTHAVHLQYSWKESGIRRNTILL